MQCKVYRSETKSYTYLYLAEGKELEDVPEALMQNFGEAEEIMQLDLNQREKLAQADLGKVKAQLSSQGYYLQLPPEHSVDELLDRSFSRSE